MGKGTQNMGPSSGSHVAIDIQLVWGLGGGQLAGDQSERATLFAD